MNAGCHMNFHWDPIFHRRMRDFVGEMKEHGVDGQLDYKSQTIRPHRQYIGEYDRVEIPQSVIMAHSHPGKCAKDDTCTIGLPSPVDLYNTLTTILKGTQYHLVFSKE